MNQGGFCYTGINCSRILPLQKITIRKWNRASFAAAITIVLLPFLYSGQDDPTLLEQAQRRDSITVLTRNGASSYFIGPEGGTGPEYDLASAFADYLGIPIKIRVADEFGDLGTLLMSRQGEFIAANLTRTPAREKLFNFGPDYAEVKTVVVYKRGKQRPRKLPDLLGLRIAVIAGSSYEDQLEEARKILPDLEWTTERNLGIEGLLLAIADEELDATLVDSNIYKIHSRFYPGLNIGFTLSEHQPQAWAFLPGDDDSLVQEARAFFKRIKENGKLTELQSHYNANGNELDRVGMFQFMKQVRKRLPPLIPVFQEGPVCMISTGVCLQRWATRSLIGTPRHLRSPECAGS
jgi:membrane-bound lytic murein transglycosylase F